jgi:hypothetical protein
MSAEKVRGGSAFSPLVIGAVILVGVFAFAAYFTLSAFAPELTTGRDGRAHALSQSAVGFAGAVRLFKARGDTISIGRIVDGQERISGLVILTPERPIDADELETASGYTTLLIMPKWAVGPDPTHRGWVTEAGMFDTASLAERISAIAPGAVIERASGATRVQLSLGANALVASGPIENLQTISGTNIRRIIVDGRGATVLGLVEQPGALPFYILSDPDFLNTQGVHDLATARAGMAIVDATRTEDDPIIFDVTLNGLGAARSPLRLAFDPPLLGATLALVIATAMLGWRASARFDPGAPSKRSIAFGKAALAGNSAALLRLGGHQRLMAPIYARLVALQIADRFARSRTDELTLEDRMDRLSATYKISPNFSTLAAEASSATTVNKMLEAARKLHAWRLEMIRATR